MNQLSNGQTQQLPEQWQNALTTMRESIAQAAAAMQLLAATMNELRPLFETAESLQAELSRYTLGPAATLTTPQAQPLVRPALPVRPASPFAQPDFAPLTASQELPGPSLKAESPEIAKGAGDRDELTDMEQYTISFKSDRPVDMMKVHSALGSIAEIRGMSLNDYGPQSAELQIWTNVEPGSLPLVEALQDSFNELPQVEPTADGLLVRFGATGSQDK